MEEAVDSVERVVECAELMRVGSLNGPTLINARSEQRPDLGLGALPFLESIDPLRARLFRSNSAEHLWAPAVDRFGSPASKIRWDLIDAWLLDGGTLVLEEIGTALRGTQWFVDAVGRGAAEAVWVNLFITRGEDGIHAHWDDNDVTVWQLAGERRWSFWEPDPKWPVAVMADNRPPMTAPDVEFEVEPGDVLAVPRGWIHGANLGDGPSAHLMCAFRVPTVWSMLHQLLDRYAVVSDRGRRNVMLDRAHEDVQNCLSELAAFAGPRIVAEAFESTRRQPRALEADVVRGISS